MHHHESGGVMQKQIVCCYQGQGHNEGQCNQFMAVPTSSDMGICLQSNLRLMVNHHKPKYRLNFCIQVKVRVTAKF